jgi:hypothetical protein
MVLLGHTHSCGAGGYNLYIEASFFPVSDAIVKLEQLPWRSMWEPAAATLRQETGPGAVWVYQADADGSHKLMACLR